MKSVLKFYYTHFEITGGPCNLIGSNWCDLFTNRTIFCFKSHLFPSQWEGYTKNHTTNQISRFTENNQSNCRKMKYNEYHEANSAVFKTLIFSPQRMDEFNLNRLSTALNWPSLVLGRFQNECNKVVIEPRVVKFWSEIILMISNQAYDFSPNCTPLSSINIIYHLLSLAQCSLDGLDDFRCTSRHGFDATFCSFLFLCSQRVITGMPFRILLDVIILINFIHCQGCRESVWTPLPNIERYHLVVNENESISHRDPLWHLVN